MDEEAKLKKELFATRLKHGANTGAELVVRFKLAQLRRKREPDPWVEEMKARLRK